MTAFRNAETLRASLKAAGLEPLADAVVASTRPVILFLRVTAPDDPLAPGTSKMGGLPDLPENFPWPKRAPYPDAAQRAAADLSRAKDLAEQWRKQAAEPLKPHQRRIEQSEIDKLVPAAEERGLIYARSFPLAFVGQIDLAALASEAGFDPDLPRTGMLSVFEDAIGEGLEGARTVFWHDQPAATLKRRQPPDDLVGYYERCSEWGHGADTPWRDLRLAETLEPFSAIAVPNHWTSAYPRAGGVREQIWNWLHSDNGEYAPSAPSYDGHGADAPQAGYFGDRLGGWPNPIQNDPETELDGRPIETPGQTPWRHLFSYGGEFYGGVRRVPSDGKGDGTTYALIRREDLAARRFERCRSIYQMD